MLRSTASDLYEECCALYGVKPNRDVMQQLSSPNFLTIRQIDASRTFLGELGVRALLEFVRSHAGIRQLVLTKNGVDAGCVEHLCIVLRESPSLSSVDLSDNPMSTPSVRVLWETVRTVPHLQQVNVDNCGISEDWVNRLGRCCKANSELQQLGFYLYGPERSPRSWETVFVLLLGSESLVQAYCNDILPFVGSFVSRLRLRIAPLTIEKTDTHEVVQGKVRRCKSTHNYGLSWCVVLIDGTTQWTGPEMGALKAVMQQEEPVIPPLRNKFGVLRDPIHRYAKHLFVYTLPYLFEEEMDGATWVEEEGEGQKNVSTVPPNLWLRAVGIKVPDDVHVPSAVALPSDRSWKIRCSSDFSTALCSVFSEQPRSMTMLEKNEDSGEKVWETIERDKHVGSLHPRCKDIIHYMESPVGQSLAPLILYGAGNLGKSNILAWAAATYSAVESLRVVPYHVSHENQSLVVLLFHLLSVFSKKPLRVFRSVEELTVEVRETIAAYDGEMILLLISSIDYLDACGSRESFLLEWLPACLPPSVRLIASLNTESPLLTALRKRMPQPYEVLITSLPKEVRADMFLQELLRRDVSGMFIDAQAMKNNGSVRRLESTKSLEGAFLMKDGSESVSFGIYTASFLQRITKNSLERDTAFLVADEVPDTLDEIIRVLLKRYEELSDALTVQYLTMSLVAAPLPISEVVYICEELGPCTRHKTMPLLLMMADDGLLKVSSDSIVHLSGNDVYRVALKLYASMQDTLSVLVETHLLRLVKTQSPDMSFCFRHLAPIMVANGSLAAAYNLVLNPTHMDALLSRDSENFAYAIDIIFRLLNTRQLLLELDEGVSCLTEAGIGRLDRRALQSALEALQLYDGYFFQAALLASDVSPYHVRAMEAAEVPYTVLVPLNRGDEDDAVHSLECKHLPVYCNLWGEYLVVTTTKEVIVYSTVDFEKELARCTVPFESNQNLHGSLVAAGTRVVIIGDAQLLLWDFGSQSFTLFEDTTSSLNGNALDSFGLSLIVRHPSKEQLSIIDVAKKKVIMELPTFEAPVREARFCGSAILARGLYDLFLMQEEKQEQRQDHLVKLMHNGVIRAVTFCNDGRFIASCVRENIWIWSGAGELLHLIDAGLTPVEDLRFNINGSLLLSWQSEGVKVWNSLNGDCAGTVEPCFDERASFVSFTEDGSQIIGRCGSHIYLWDANTYHPLGVLTASAGHFIFIQERNQVVVGTTSQKRVKVWRIGTDPIPPIQRAKEKQLTSMWRKNARLSMAPIVRVDCNLNGTLLTAVDNNGFVILQPMDGTANWNCDVRHVESTAIMAGMLLFTLKGEGHHFFWKPLYESGVVNEVFLPVEAVRQATLELATTEVGGLIAVISNSEQHSMIYVYSIPDWSLTNQFLGHSGRIVYAVVAGEFLFSLGVDCTVRLWSLLRHAERASYTHDRPILAAAEGPSMTLFFVDDQSRLYHVHVENIASSTHARFVAEAVELPLAIPATVRARQIVYTSDLLAMAAEDGSVYLVNLRQGGAVSRLSNYNCLSLAFTVDGSDTHLVTGHSTGEVVLHLVRFTESM